MDLSMTWLYAEYTNYLTNRAGENDMDALENYNCCIELILTILTQQKCMSMMSQIIKQESGFYIALNSTRRVLMVLMKSI